MPETDTLIAVAEVPIVTAEGQADTIVALAPVAAPPTPIHDLFDTGDRLAACATGGMPKDAKDWAPLREKARKRARITLTKVWEDPAKGWAVHRTDYRRFCYKDYPTKNRRALSITEKPDIIGIKTDALVNDANAAKGKRNAVLAHYVLSLRGGRLAVYSCSKTRVRHTMPGQIDLSAGVDGLRTLYPEAYDRFSRRLVKLLRSKARANGVKLAKGDDLCAVLEATLWPALEAVKAHHKAVRDGATWTPQQSDRWLLRHMHCTAAELPKEMTGYGSKAVTKLLWESMKPIVCRPLPGGGTWTDTGRADWKRKWAWLALLRTWLPVDHSQQILRAPKIAQWDDEWSKDPRTVRKLLKQWEPKRVVRMLTETCADSSTIRDTLNMLAERKGRLAGEAVDWERDHLGEPIPAAEPVPRTRDALELHEWLVAESRRAYARERQLREARRLLAMTPEQRAAEEERERKARAPFEHSDELKSVAGKTVTTADSKTHAILLPEGPVMMVEWGASMHNCIGSYASWVRDGTCQILGVRATDSQRPCDYGIEVRGGEIQQFRGLYNADASAELRGLVEGVLLAAKVLDPLSCTMQATVRYDVVNHEALNALMAAPEAALGPDERADALEMAVQTLRLPLPAPADQVVALDERPPWARAA